MPTRPFHSTAPSRLLIAASAAFFSLTGCSHQPPEFDPHVEQMKAEAEKPAMSAEDTFFEGKLLVEANLGHGFGGRGSRGGPGGGGHRGGGKHMGGSGPGEGRGMGGSEGPGSGGEGGGFSEGGGAIHESNMPPAALRLRLTNTGKETMEVTFTLCKSELGDFAVRPEKLALAPGQSAEPDHMTSRLGLTTDELVLKVGLRLAGKVEQKDLVLKVGTPSEPTSAPEPTASLKPQS